MNPNALAETFDGHFKFKPGDLVVERSVLESYRIDIEANKYADKYGQRARVPMPGTICSRRLEQCHGGTQGFYVLQCRATDGGMISAVVPDHSVVAFAEMAELCKTVLPEAP